MQPKEIQELDVAQVHIIPPTYRWKPPWQEMASGPLVSGETAGDYAATH